MKDLIKAAIVAKLQRQADISRGDGLQWFEAPAPGDVTATVDGELNIAALAEAVECAIKQQKT